MDNPHATIPFLTFAHMGSPMDVESYQFHLLALALEGENDGAQAAHGQITTLRAAAVHPIVQGLPLGLRQGLEIFRLIRAGLGVANVWGAAARSPENTAALGADANGHLILELHCTRTSDSVRSMQAVIERVSRALRRLGCFVPRSMTQLLPLGSSAHYAGTIPMSDREDEHTCRADGRVRGFQNLLVADGAAFPSVPAKNLTFTLMANAARIADSFSGLD